jgi:hypothetical protein
MASRVTVGGDPVARGGFARPGRHDLPRLWIEHPEVVAIAISHDRDVGVLLDPPHAALGVAPANDVSQANATIDATRLENAFKAAEGAPIAVDV